MIVIAIGTANVQRHTSRLRETLQTVRDHLSAQVADFLTLEAEVDHRIRPTGEINDSPGEGLVERRIATAEASEGLAGAEGLSECCAEGEESIFGCVVVVNWRSR